MAQPSLMKQLLTILTKVTAICLIFLSVTGYTARAQEVITLQKAVALALERNLTIKQSQFTEALANEDYKQANYNRLPSLSVGPQASYNFGRSPNLNTYSYSSQSFLYVTAQGSLALTVFQGGQLKNQILENKLLLDVDKTATAKVRNDLTLNVVTDFLQILTNTDLVTAAQQQINIAKLTLDKSQKSFDAGSQTLADLSQAKAGLSTAELNLVTAQNQLELSILVLKQYMEMDPATKITIEKPDISKLKEERTAFNVDEIIKQALTINPDVQLAEEQQTASEQNIKIAKGNYYPTLSFFTNLNSNFSSVSQNILGATSISQQIGVVQDTKTPVIAQVQAPVYASTYPFYNQFANNFNQSVGLNLQIPIFNRFSARTSVRKAKITYENARVATQLAKNTLSKTIYQAVFDAQAAQKRYVSASQTYQANKDAFFVIQQRYNVGLVNSLDYNTSLTNLNKAQNDMIEAQYEVIFRSKVIDYYLGNPIKL
jgi:outer membrane protein